MPSLTEEAPDYQQKVAAYLKKWHLDRLPWGFIVAHGHMVATTSTEERQHRGFLGDIAIAQLAKYGVTEADLEAILDGEVRARASVPLPPPEPPAPADPQEPSTPSLDT